MSEKERRERDNGAAVLISSTSWEPERTSNMEDDNATMPRPYSSDISTTPRYVRPWCYWINY